MEMSKPSTSSSGQVETDNIAMSAERSIPASNNHNNTSKRKLSVTDQNCGKRAKACSISSGQIQIDDVPSGSKNPPNIEVNSSGWHKDSRTLPTNYIESENPETSIDYAWNDKKFDVVLKHVQDDGPFPEEFDSSLLTNSLIKARFNLHIKTRDCFHDHIENNNFDEVKKFVNKYPSVKFAYVLQNQCALTTALNSERFEIYSFLRSKGYSCGVDENHDLIMEELENSKKKNLRIEIEKYFKSYNLDVLNLMSKSKLGAENEQEDFKKVIKLFEELCEIEEFEKVLEIVINAKEITLTFDFTCDTVCGVDPTRCLEDGIKGRTYSKEIFIAAKQDSNVKVLGTLAHEMTHFALNYVYKNKFLPFYENNQDTRKKYFDIIDECRRKSKMHPKSNVITNVFRCKDDEIGLELIVRVPHLMALYAKDQNKLDHFKIKFKKLFDFYHESVLPDLTREVPLINLREKIQEHNKLLGVYSKASRSTIATTKPKIEFEISEDKNFLIESQLPELVLQNLIKLLKKNNARRIDSQHIFVEIGKLFDNKLFEDILQIFNSDLKPRLIIIDSAEVNIEKVNLILNQIAEEDGTIFLSARNNLEIEARDSFNLTSVKYDWEDLTEDSKQRTLKKKLNFQGSEVALDEIITIVESFLFELPLEDILGSSSIQIKSVDAFLPQVCVFIERTYMTASNLPLNTETLTNLVVADKAVIIADSAGTGKTTSAVKISKVLKDKNSLSWIFYIDLKVHTLEYIADGQDQPEIVDVKFFSEHLLKFKSQFKRKLFENFFLKGKTIFVIDGFDEISPSFKDFVLKVIKAIQKFKNCLLVTSRVHLAKDLEVAVGQTAIKLKPFTQEQQIDYLIEFWSKTCKKLPSASLDMLRLKATLLLEKFQKALTEKDFLEVPLQLYMLAEIFGPESDFSEIFEMNSFVLYHKFVTRKTEIWLNDKGPLAKEDIAKLNLTIYQMHHKFAIECLLGEEKTESFNFLPMEDPITGKPFSNEIVARIGLIRFLENGQPQFTHQTFVEYFVANFIFEQLTMRSDSDEVYDFFLEVLLKENFENVRKFLNDILQKVQKKLKIDKTSKKLEDKFTIHSNIDCLEPLVVEKQTSLIFFLLETLKLSKKVKLDFVKRTNIQNIQVFHVATTHFETFITFWTCIETFADEDDRKELLNSVDSSNRTVLAFAIKNQDVFKYILAVAQNLMSSEEFLKILQAKNVEFNTILHMTPRFKDYSAFDVLWSAVEKLSIDDQKQLLTEPGFHKRNILHKLAYRNSSKGAKSILAKIKELLGSELSSSTELSEFLFLGDGDNENFIQLSAEYCDFGFFRDLWQFCLENLSESEQKMLLLARNRQGQDTLLTSVLNKDKSAMAQIVGVVKGKLSKKDYRNSLITRDYYGKHFLKVLKTDNLEEMAWIEDPNWIREELEKEFSGENVECLNVLKKAIESNMDEDNLVKLLNEKSESGELTLHLTFNFGSVDLINKLLGYLSAKFTDDKKPVENILSLQGFKKRNILFLSLSNPDLQATSILWKFVGEFLDADFVETLLHLKDDSLKTICFWAIIRNHPVLIEILQWYKDKFDHKKFVDFFKINRLSNTLAHYVAGKSNEALNREFFNFISSSFDNEEDLNTIILSKNDVNEIPLQYFLYNKDASAARVIFEFYLDKLKDKKLKQILFKSNFFDYFNCKNRNKKTIDEFKAVAIDHYRR